MSHGPQAWLGLFFRPSFLRFTFKKAQRGWKTRDDFTFRDTGTSHSSIHLVLGDPGPCLSITVVLGGQVAGLCG